MGDWIGLALIMAVLGGVVFGLSHLGEPPKPLTRDEYERRAQEGRGAATAGVIAGMYALQKLMNPKAAEAVEVHKGLRAGYYNDQQGTGDGGDGSAEQPRGVAGG